MIESAESSAPLGAAFEDVVIENDSADGYKAASGDFAVRSLIAALALAVIGMKASPSSSPCGSGSRAVIFLINGLSLLFNLGD